MVFMSHVNIKVKAKSSKNYVIREILKSEYAYFKGPDHQIDIYFKVKNGRLKLRQGDIENFLIYYEREDVNNIKRSDVILYKTKQDTRSLKYLKEILHKCFEVINIVDKKREIYFIGNVKFHLDDVADLGEFLEIEAIDKKGNIGIDKLRQQCRHYCNLFNLREEDLISKSYSDLLLEKYS